VERVVLFVRTDASYYRVSRMIVSVSTNGVDFEAVGTVSWNDKVYNNDLSSSLILENINRNVRYVKIQGEKDLGDGYQMVFQEMAIWGTKVPDPAALTFSPNGGTLAETRNVVVACATPDAVIRYTTDGSDPSETNGTVIASGGSVLVNQALTLKALAWVNGTAGKIKTATFTPTSLLSGNNLDSGTLVGGAAFNPTTPTLPAGATYAWVDNSNGEMVTTDAGNKQTNGAMGNGPSEANSSFDGGAQSATAVFAFADSFRVEKVVLFVRTEASYYRVSRMIVSVSSNGVDFETVGTANWNDRIANNDYIASLVVDNIHRDARYIKIRGEKDPGDGYQMVFQEMAIWGTEVPSPAALTFDPDGRFLTNPKNVTMTCATADATIRYTTDGTDPSETNGTVIVSGGSVLVDKALTLKARAWVNGTPGKIKSATYTFPTVYNRPETIPYSDNVTVDGSLADWSDAAWTPLDQVYDGAGATDVTQAFFAARWGDHGNKVYIAVKVLDTAHHFTDNYDVWNTRDAVELYLHTTSMDGVNYGLTQETAQEYAIGITAGDPNAVWTAIGSNKSVPPSADFQAAGRVDGQWLYYEAALTPFEYFGGFTSRPNVISTLYAGEVIGLDVTVVSHNGSTYTGMKSENAMGAKFGDYTRFGLHQLAAAAIPGDANNDSKVDVSDLGILAANYGTTTDATWSTGDFNHDGKVDVSDLGILAANYGTGTGSVLDFNQDAQAFGLGIEAKEEAPATSSLGCGTAGLPLIAGLLAMGLFLVKLEE